MTKKQEFNTYKNSLWKIINDAKNLLNFPKK